MGEMTIFFTRWFVENYEQAKYMKLDGWNLHKKLLTPYRVEVLSNKLGSCSMVGNNAKEIANAADALDAVLDVNNSLIGQSRQR